jgi:hypothetical protein
MLVRKETIMPRTDRALQSVAPLLTRCAAAAAAATLLAGFATGPATAGPDAREIQRVQSTDTVRHRTEHLDPCTPHEPAGYDAMQDYVDTLIWWHYHPDWRVD